jgi:CheY-like chemotaxis protein
LASAGRKILIVDPDMDSIRPLSKALRQRGHAIYYAPDGSRALELAILRYPHLVLVAEESPLLPARTFVQILRSNPRTEHIPVILTLDGRSPDKGRVREGALKKPFNVDEVLARIDHVFRRVDAAKELKSESKEIEGTLTQLPIADLLQVLALNKRSGRLNLSRSGAEGELYVGEGKPLNAKAGAVEGEKALFRLLSWTDGTFSFVPGPPTANVRIHRGMEDALMEGMRQADEVARLLPSLPPRSAVLHLAPDSGAQPEQHPVTAQVLDLLSQPKSLGEVVDASRAVDLDTLFALSTLMQKGVVRVASGPSQEGLAPLLNPAEVHALRTRIFRGGKTTKLAVGKVFLCGAPAMCFRRVMSELPGLIPAGSTPAAVQSQFGTLGSLVVGEGLRVDFQILPPMAAASPLWRPFSSGAVGALLLEPEDPHLGLARFLAFEARVPVVVVGAEVPAMLSRAPSGAASVGVQLPEALRALLVQALNPVAPLTAGYAEERRPEA